MFNEFLALNDHLLLQLYVKWHHVLSDPLMIRGTQLDPAENINKKLNNRTARPQKNNLQKDSEPLYMENRFRLNVARI